MNDETHSDIRRRLTPGAAPTPPPDLAERIKNGIPSNFAVRPVPAPRERNPWASAWAIAASLLLVVNATYFGLRFLLNDYNRSSTAPVQQADRGAEADIPRTLGQSPASLPAEPPPSDIRPSLTALPAPPPPAVASRTFKSVGNVAAAAVPRDLESSVKENKKEGASDRRVDDSMAVSQASVADAAPAMDAAAAAPAAATKATSAEESERQRPSLQARVAAKEVFREQTASSRSGGLLSKPAAAAAPVPPSVIVVPHEAPPVRAETDRKVERSRDEGRGLYGPTRLVRPGGNPSRFSLDVSTRSYDQTLRDLEAGKAPAAGSIKVEEFVNRFDYNDPAPPKGSDFTLTLEGIAAPFHVVKNEKLVRVSVRARELTPQERTRGLTAPVAFDAVAAVTFDPGTVSRYRLLMDGADQTTAFVQPPTSGDNVEAGTAVSALYQLTLNPGVAEDAPLAIVRIDYRTLPDRIRRVASHSFRMGAIAGDWETATPSMRLASLLASTAQLLKSRGYHVNAALLNQHALSLRQSFGASPELDRLIAAVETIVRLQREGVIP